MDLTFSVVDNTALVQQATDEQIEQALIAIGAMVESHAKNYVPIDTGRLKNSITYAVAGQGASTKSYGPDKPVASDTQSKPYTGKAPSDPGGKPRSVYVGSNVEYAEIVENGVAGRRNKHAHFLRNAIVNHMEEYKSLAEKALRSP